MARVSYADREDLPPDYQHLIESSLQGRPINAYRVLGSNHHVLKGQRDFFSSLWEHSGLTPRQRELVTLAVARELDSEYEWHQHVKIASSEGITPREMGAISAGSWDTFEPITETLMQYTTAVLSGHVDDLLHDEMSSHFDDASIVGITLLIAGYQLAACFLCVLEVDLEEPFIGWDLENFDAENVQAD